MVSSEKKKKEAFPRPQHFLSQLENPPTSYYGGCSFPNQLSSFLDLCDRQAGFFANNSWSCQGPSQKSAFCSERGARAKLSKLHSKTLQKTLKPPKTTGFTLNTSTTPQRRLEEHHENTLKRLEKNLENVEKASKRLEKHLHPQNHLAQTPKTPRGALEKQLGGTFENASKTPRKTSKTPRKTSKTPRINLENTSKTPRKGLEMASNNRELSGQPSSLRVERNPRQNTQQKGGFVEKRPSSRAVVCQNGGLR